MKTTRAKSLSKGRGQAEKIALNELKSMLPFFLICDALVLIICLVYWLFTSFEHFSYNYFTGLFFGNLAGAANFYLMARGSERAMLRRSGHSVKSSTGLGYGLRLIALFILYGALITFELINPFVSVIPLLYPSFYYKFKAIFNKSV
jgi:hypothetical protein